MSNTPGKKWARRYARKAWQTIWEHERMHQSRLARKRGDRRRRQDQR